MPTTIIEVRGVKMEIDLEKAVRVNEFRVGDQVKVLKKEYDSHKVYPAVIVGFENFKALPTIVVAVLKVEYARVEMEMMYYNEEAKFELVPAGDLGLPFAKENVIQKLQSGVFEKEKELNDAKLKLDYFIHNFNKTFKEFESLSAGTEE